jgi:hypothetical protein
LSFGEIVLHGLVCLLAVLDFADQFSPGFREVAHSTRNKALPPKMLLLIGALWSLSCTDTDEDTDLASRPFVTYSLVKDLWCGVVFSTALVKEYRLADLNGFKRQCRRTCCAPSLPDGRFGLDRGFFARVVGAEENLAGARLLGTFVDSCDSPVNC